MRKHTYAQHFLRSPRVVAELVGHTNIRKNDTVYDLGAGSGIIASVLARRAKHVIAVEIEPEAYRKLEQNLSDEQNVTLLKKDILKLEVPETAYKIVANIPFNLSAKIVRQFAFAANPPKAMYFVVQKQFAMKLVPSDRHFNSELGAELWPWYSVRIRKPLRKTDFTPPPAVDTVLLEIKRLEEPLLMYEKQQSYGSFVEQAFAEQKFYASLPRGEVKISAERKPSELSPEQWVRLYEAYTKKK